MNTTNQVSGQRRLFRVRAEFLASCAVAVAVLLLPDAVAHSYFFKRVVLLLAALAILSGWLMLLKDRQQKKTWQGLVALVAAIYLIASLPVFLFEISQVKWLVLHPWHHWFSMYAMPWVHWGYAAILLSIICSFFGRGRSRVAFVAGSILLLVLRLATGTWVY